MLSRENFYAEKQHSNKILPFDAARGSGNYASRTVYIHFSLLIISGVLLASFDVTAIFCGSGAH